MPSEIVIEEPNDKQREFFLARARYVAYGGARGGGKSWAVRKKAQLMALKYGGIKILILRRTFPELRTNHILPLVADLQNVARYKEVDKTIYFPNGSMIIFGYCDTDKDVGHYQGQEYDVIFMDEATHFTEYMFDTLKVCVRGANDFPRRFYLTCNPGGVGHEWVKRLFITRQYRASERPEDYQFIKALVYDNKVLMEKDPEYVRQLENLPDGLREAWLEGSWDVFAGQYFPEFDARVHTCEPFAIPHTGAFTARWTMAWICWPVTGSRWMRTATAMCIVSCMRVGITIWAQMATVISFQRRQNVSRSCLMTVSSPG